MLSKEAKIRMKLYAKIRELYGEQEADDPSWDYDVIVDVVKDVAVPYNNSPYALRMSESGSNGIEVMDPKDGAVLFELPPRLVADIVRFVSACYTDTYCMLERR